MLTTTTKTRREFTDEFKREAVVLLRDNGRPLTQVAAELGSEPSVLRRWRSLPTGRDRRRLRFGPALLRSWRWPSSWKSGICAESWNGRRWSATPQKSSRHLLESAEMRFRFIEDHREVFLVQVMCSVLRVSASGYYAWRGRPESARALANKALVEDIRRVHAGSRRCDGSPRVHASLRAEGKRVGCNRVARLMRAHGIQAHRRRPFRKTTDSNHAFPPAPNLLDRQFASATAPNQVWLADLTRIATGEGWLYLAAIVDLFSRKVVGWARSETMPQELTLAALNMAITIRNPGPGLLHHSDRGGQYAAHACRRVLDEHGTRCSMSRKGNCWDNAPMKSFFGGLKTELDGDGPFDTRQRARPCSRPPRADTTASASIQASATPRPSTKKSSPRPRGP